MNSLLLQIIREMVGVIPARQLGKYALNLSNLTKCKKITAKATTQQTRNNKTKTLNVNPKTQII